MTDQSTPNRLNRASNAVFEATSFLNGTNTAYVEQLYARYLSDPNSVEQGWQTYFAQLGEKDLTPTQLGRGPAWKRDSRPALANGELVAALTGQEPPASAKGPGKKAAAPAAASPAAVQDAAKHSVHAVQMIRAYRTVGHLEANLDPLGITHTTPQPTLHPASYGFADAELDQPVYVDGALGLDNTTPRQLVDALRTIY